MNEPLEFICPQCSAQVNVPPSQAGQRIDCPRCSAKVLVPGTKAVPDDIFANIFDDPVKNPEPVSDVAAESTEPWDDVSDDDDVELVLEPEQPKTAPQSGQASGSEEPPTETAAGDDETADIATPVGSTDAAPAAADDSMVQELLPVEDISPPEEFPVIKNLDQDRAHVDPFKDRSHPKIRIDGIDGEYGTDMISILCPVCDSRVYAQRSRAGGKIKCDDCFSMVDVPSLEEWQDEIDQADSTGQKTHELTFTAPDDIDSDLKLGDPVDLPKIDYNVSDEFGLEPVDHDLLSPKSAQPGSQPYIPPSTYTPYSPEQPSPEQPSPDQPLAPTNQPTAPVHPIETELFNRPDAGQNTSTGQGQGPGPGPDPDPQRDQPMMPEPVEEEEPTEEGGMGFELLPLDDDPGPSEASSLSPSPVSPSSQDGDDYRLSPIADEQSKTPLAAPVITSPIANQANEPESGESEPDASVESDEKVKEPKDHAAAAAEDSSANKSGPFDFNDEIKGWGSAIASGFKQADGLIHMGIFAGLLIAGLSLISIGHHYMKSGETVIVAISYVPWAFGCFFWLVSFIYEGIILYNVILLGLYKKSDAGEWPEFNVTELFGQTMNVGLANILSCLPGLAITAALAQLDNWAILLAPFFMFTSRMLIGPPLMMSALKNQTFYKMVSPKIFDSLNKATFEWLVFYGFMGVLAVIMILAATLARLDFCMLYVVYGALFTVFLVVYGSMIGHQFKKIMVKLGETDRLGDDTE